MRFYKCIIFFSVLIRTVYLTAQSSEPHCNGFLFDQVVKTALSSSIPAIDVKDLYAQQSKYTILDARDIQEYNVSHIKGALHIGYENLNWEILKTIDKNHPIALYCSIGYRSEKVAEQLRDRGYTNVVNVYGSIFEWVNRGYEVVGKTGQPINKVHGYSKAWGIWVSNPKIVVVY